MNYFIYRVAGHLVATAIDWVMNIFRRKENKRIELVNSLVSVANKVGDEARKVTNLLDITYTPIDIRLARVEIVRLQMSITTIRKSMDRYHEILDTLKADPRAMVHYRTYIDNCQEHILSHQNAMINSCRRFDVICRNRGGQFSKLTSDEAQIVYRDYIAAFA